MSDAWLQLRTAAFGGVQKQDVLDYIKKMNLAHNEALESVKKELEEASKAKAGLEEQKAEGDRREEALNSVVERLTQEEAERRQEEEAAQAVGCDLLVVARPQRETGETLADILKDLGGGYEA